MSSFYPISIGLALHLPVTFRHGLLQGQVFNLQLGAQVAGQPYSDCPVHTYLLLYHQARPQGCGPPWKSWGARTFPSMAGSSRDLLPCHITAAGRKNQGGGVSQTFCVIRNECHRSHFRGRWPARCCKQLSPGGAGPAAGGTVARVPSAPCRPVSPVLEPAWHVAVSSLIGRVVFFSLGALGHNHANVLACLVRSSHLGSGVDTKRGELVRRRGTRRRGGRPKPLMPPFTLPY